MNELISKESHLSNTEANRYYIFMIWIIAAFFLFSTDITLKISDNFHEGEYLGLIWHMIDYYKGDAPFPVLIHGAMDYLPVIAAKHIYGNDCLIIGTRLINTAITFLVWILFLDLYRMIVNISGGGPIVHVLYLIGFIALTPRLYSDALTIQQNFLSIRDVFLILVTWGLVKTYINLANKKLVALYIILSGLAVSFGFYWHYSRGIIGVLMFFAFCTAFIVRRYYFPIFISFFAIIGCFFIIEIWGGVGPLSSNLQNILYWIKNAEEIWGTSIFTDIRTSSVFYLYTIFAITMILSISLSMLSSKKKDWYLCFLMTSLIIAQAVLLKSASNRFGSQLFWPIWPSLLMLIYMIPNFFPYLSQEKQIINLQYFGKKSILYLRQYFQIKPFYGFKIISQYLFFIGFFLIVLAFFISSNFIRYISFFKNAISPHKDTILVSQEILKVVKNMEGVSCFFAWTNEGTIALMLKKPYCSQFTYAIYTSRSYQDELIASLRLNNPQLILTDSASISIEFDGKPMDKRLPNVGIFLEQNYKFRSRVNDYVVSTKYE